MSVETGCLVLMLDAPLQSWGHASRFQRRTTSSYPTKSAVIGMLSAAMGLAKGSLEEADTLPKLSSLKMSSIALPRVLAGRDVSPQRLTDYHTVGGGYEKKSPFIPRKASGDIDDNPTITHREYLLDALFGVIFEGDRQILEGIKRALDNPVWGLWFGRKCCIPAAPIFRGIVAHRDEALCLLLGEESNFGFVLVEETEKRDEASFVILDQPVSFGDGISSGSAGREYAARPVSVKWQKMAGAE